MSEQHALPPDQAEPGQNAGDDYQSAIAEGYLPIREVARITGVNAVTLRAWERRYGLIVPHRTPKGHRLYHQNHVERIQAILTWLNRGVAVSQVKGLLRGNNTQVQEADSQWQQKCLHMQSAIYSLNERSLDECLNRELAVYPPHTLYTQLLKPLLDALQLRWQGQFGSQVEQVFFYSWLRSKLGARVYHNNRQHNSAPVLMINLSDLPMAPELWLSAWLVSSAECPVEVYDWPIPVAELALIAEHVQPRALVLHSSQSLNSQQLPKLIGSCDCPCLITGATVEIHQQLLEQLAADNSQLLIARDPLASVHALSDLDLLNS